MAFGIEYTVTLEFDTEGKLRKYKLDSISGYPEKLVKKVREQLESRYSSLVDEPAYTNIPETVETNDDSGCSGSGGYIDDDIDIVDYIVENNKRTVEFYWENDDENEDDDDED